MSVVVVRVIYSVPRCKAVIIWMPGCSYVENHVKKAKHMCISSPVKFAVSVRQIPSCICSHPCTVAGHKYPRCSAGGRSLQDLGDLVPDRISASSHFKVPRMSINTVPFRCKRSLVNRAAVEGRHRRNRKIWPLNDVAAASIHTFTC